MNAVEIEQAVSALAERPFDPDEFPFMFLTAFGNKATTIKRLRSGATNASDVGGVLQRNNIHIKVCPEGDAAATLTKLKASAATYRAKVKYLLATDGKDFQAEEVSSGQILVCDYPDVPDHFGFFLPLAGITTVRQIRENPVDIRATSRLNRLYVQLLKDNPEWGALGRQQDMNQFMARLIFCFFAEDTDIFPSGDLFTGTIETMSDRDSSNTHQVIGELFRAMNTKPDTRDDSRIKRWARAFPYVNGGLFSGSTEAPWFSRIARSYLLHIGNLDWKKINPDIFGSMIQAVTDDEERGSLGMHYTSVPNILKVLNPLFLDDLREKLKEGGDNPRKLLNLRNRMARIRVFDPACGSGNFLVIAYKEMRAIEAEINVRRGDVGHKTVIPLTNFRGIEIREFPAEVARLALIIAEYQCDVLYRGQQEALAEFLPLDTMNWITCGNALRIDWLSLCPPTGAGVIHNADDLFQTPLDQTRIDFDNEGGETYICGNPPYLGSTWQSKKQKQDLKSVFENRITNWKSLDYVAGWFMRAVDYGSRTNAHAAFVTTNSICQGQQAGILWPAIFATNHQISFAHTSFKWANLAKHNAGVTVCVVGISKKPKAIRKLFSVGEDGETFERKAENINAYLVPNANLTVSKIARPINDLCQMSLGNKPVDSGNLLLTRDELSALRLTSGQREQFVRRFYGSKEFIHGLSRYCLWIENEHLVDALDIPCIATRIRAVEENRLKSKKAATRKAAVKAHRFGEVRQSGTEAAIVVPGVSSENRPYLPVGLVPAGTIISNRNFALYDAPLWNMALIASRLHWVWVGTVCLRFETRFSYSNTMGWNTFPVPKLTRKNVADLTRCSEDILLARERHFPATLAALYKLGNMPEDLKLAHEHNDEVLERIYIGRRFRNDTERLEHLFDMYARMTEGGG